MQLEEAALLYHSDVFVLYRPDSMPNEESRPPPLEIINVQVGINRVTGHAPPPTRLLPY